MEENSTPQNGVEIDHIGLAAASRNDPLGREVGLLTWSRFDFSQSKREDADAPATSGQSTIKGMYLSSWMRRKRLRWWAALLLPALVLRSLIPLGFMPMFGPGYGVQFVLCEGYAPVPGTTSSLSTSMSMDMPMDAATDPPRQNDAPPVDGGAPVHQDHGTCPYGSAPALGGLPALAVVLVAVQPPAEPAVVAAQVGYFGISPRAQSSRGPPA